MNFSLYHIARFFSRNLGGKTTVWLMAVIFAFGCSACFTGIESTKKINLSREDKRNAEPTAEEKFMEPVKAVALRDWETGRQFIASDDKALLVIVPQRGLSPLPPDSIKGKLLEFVGVESKINAAGDLTVGIVFSDGFYTYSYDSGKEFEYAMENIKSDQIPMLIDLQMVEETRKLLTGQKLFTKSPLWYDADGTRIEGKKFVEITIEDVQPGNLVFPLRLKILAPDNEEAYIFMNYGNADNESRAFHNIFSLTDIHRRYPAIDDETWKFISAGKVREGMTKEEVKLSLGNPSDSNSGHDYSQTIDIWSYENGRVLWFEDGRLVKIRQ